jgi:hypothetical protein
MRLALGFPSPATRLLGASVGVATLLALSACGSSGKTNTASPSSGTSSVPSSTQTKVTAKGGGDFCKLIAAQLNDSKKISAEAATTGSAATIKTLIENARSESKVIADNAPSEVKADVKTVLDATQAFYDSLAAANYDFTKVDFTKLKALTSADVVAASGRLSAYVTTKCGIDVSVPSATP